MQQNGEFIKIRGEMYHILFLTREGERLSKKSLNDFQNSINNLKYFLTSKLVLSLSQHRLTFLLFQPTVSVLWGCILTSNEQQQQINKMLQF